MKRVLALALASIMAVSSPMTVSAEEIIQITDGAVETEVYAEEAEDAALTQEDASGTAAEQLEIVTFLNGKDALLEKYKVDFGLTSAMKAQKKELYTILGNLERVVPGKDYLDGQLVAIVEDKDMAEDVAEGFDGELLSFQDGVAVVESELSTMDAITLAADQETKLPAVYPNYIYTIDDEKKYETIDNISAPEKVDFEAFTKKAEEAIGADKAVPVEELKSENEVGEADDTIEVTLETGEANTGAEYPYNDPDIEKQWHHDMIDTFAAWNAAPNKGKDVTVAVIDTGIDKTHPEFAGRVAAVNKVSSESSDGTDQNGHGTHVAGIIGAAADNGVGGTGVAPEVNILAVRVLNAKGSGTTADIIAGVNYAANDSDVRVINMSLGGPSGVTDIPYEAAVKSAVQKGIVVVVAAGNDGWDISKADYKTSPACFEDAVTVASLDVNGDLSNFSNYGFIDISAPGGTLSSFEEQDIYSTVPLSMGGFDFYPGTSMASPVVAGVAALMVSTGSYAKNSAGAEKLVEKLEDTAVNIGKSKNFGAGRVNAAAAVDTMSIYAKGENFSVAAGKKLVLKAVTDSSEKVEWSVSDEKVCTIKNGTLKANKAVDKKTVVTVTAKCGTKKASVDVTVWPNTSQITFEGDKKSVTLDYHQSTQFKVKTSDGSPVIYKSSNNKVAVASESGKVMGLANGTATITATAVNGKKVSLKVKVTGTPYVIDRIVPVSAKDKKGAEMFAQSFLGYYFGDMVPVSEGKSVKYKALSSYPYNTSSDKKLVWACYGEGLDGRRTDNVSVKNGVLKIGRNLSSPTLVLVGACPEKLRQNLVVAGAFACRPLAGFNFSSSSSFLLSDVKTSTSQKVSVGKEAAVPFHPYKKMGENGAAMNPYPYLESSDESVATVVYGEYSDGTQCAVIEGKKKGKCKVSIISMDGAYRKATINVTVE